MHITAIQSGCGAIDCVLPKFVSGLGNLALLEDIKLHTNESHLFYQKHF